MHRKRRLGEKGSGLSLNTGKREEERGRGGGDEGPIEMKLLNVQGLTAR